MQDLGASYAKSPDWTPKKNKKIIRADQKAIPTSPDTMFATKQHYLNRYQQWSLGTWRQAQAWKTQKRYRMTFRSFYPGANRMFALWTPCNCYNYLWANFQWRSSFAWTQWSKHQQNDIPDELRAPVFFERQQELAKQLSVIIQLFWETAKMLTDLKEHNLSTIFKKGSKCDRTNCSPVNATAISCKIVVKKLQENLLGLWNYQKILRGQVWISNSYINNTSVSDYGRRFDICSGLW